MNPEQLRRALARRNEATHPVELPPPDWPPCPPEYRDPYLVEPDDACHVCGLGPEHGDPVAHFKDPARFGDYVMAHGDCGAANGLELA